MTNRQLWLLWCLTSVAFVGVLALSLVATTRAAEHPRLAQVRAWFVPGKTSHAHYQIELACESCHTKPFGGAELRQAACEGCHASELKESGDRHPLSKFTDPRNAPLLERIDATRCETCHTEHRPEITLPMGLTQPADFCVHCHVDIARDRPSHAGFRFDTCSSAGCHRYHDNQATYEDFLLKHAGEPAMLPMIETHTTNLAEIAGFLASYPSDSFPIKALTANDADMPETAANDLAAREEWLHSGHSRNGVNCSACHATAAAPDTWIARPRDAVCTGCHALQERAFQAGRHGMRRAVGLPPMQPRLARLPMRADSDNHELGCTACHSAHRVDRVTAARDACLGCHADEHSLAFDTSPHGRQWAEAQQGKRPAAESVSCATCHMPVVEHRVVDADVLINLVQHNQDATLRPSGKMLRPVCLRCHGLEFSTNALADTQLTQRNFAGMPAINIASTAMALQRDEEIRKKREQEAADRRE